MPDTLFMKHKVHVSSKHEPQNKLSLLIAVFVLLTMLFIYAPSGYAATGQTDEPDEQSGMQSQAIVLGAGQVDRTGWGKYSANERYYFKEMLPAIFKRTLVIDSCDRGRGLRWIFTGPRAGFKLEIQGRTVTFDRSYYDSPGFWRETKKSRHPEMVYDAQTITAESDIRTVTVSVDCHLTLAIEINGKTAVTLATIDDYRRHQIHLTGDAGEVRLKMLRPNPIPVRVTVDPGETYQQMLGWGGIGTPTAYHELSSEGKKRWWNILCEYNLLCQREYPVGSLLKPSMDNWDTLEYAKAHYYGDNFPNGEVSDFEYNRMIQELGGFVMFEFWDLPEWVGFDAAQYAKAMVGYCKAAKEKTGKAPRIVGIQNEKHLPEEHVHAFVTSLRKGLDEAGFGATKIHMANASTIKRALERAPAYTNDPEVFPAIDYSATNMYDFQEHFRDIDGFDGCLQQWHQAVKKKPFISTELCINKNLYQTDSYRVAFTMAHLYHKNLTITDAVMICYCWTILNTEQPSYGYTRSLFVSNPEQGCVPTPSSNQLRIFGAYSRRIKEGMIRVAAIADHNDLLVCAFKGKAGRATVVAINRSIQPMAMTLSWKHVQFDTTERVDPYCPNLIQSSDRTNPVTIAPGAVVTLTNVPLNTLPETFFSKNPL